MKSVLEVLAEYQKELKINAESTQLGDEESKLLDNLEKIIVRNRKVFYLIIIMLLIAFMLSIIFIWYWRENTAVLVGIFAATGISIPWAINSIIGLWKDISNAETLHVLVSHLDDKATTKKIISLLSDKLYK